MLLNIIKLMGLVPLKTVNIKMTKSHFWLFRYQINWLWIRNIIRRHSILVLILKIFVFILKEIAFVPKWLFLYKSRPTFRRSGVRINRFVCLWLTESFCTKVRFCLRLLCIYCAVVMRRVHYKSRIHIFLFVLYSLTTHSVLLLVWTKLFNICPCTIS